MVPRQWICLWWTLVTSTLLFDLVHSFTTFFYIFVFLRYTFTLPHMTLEDITRPGYCMIPRNSKDPWKIRNMNDMSEDWHLLRVGLRSYPTTRTGVSPSPSHSRKTPFGTIYWPKFSGVSVLLLLSDSTSTTKRLSSRSYPSILTSTLHVRT